MDKQRARHLRSTSMGSALFSPTKAFSKFVTPKVIKQDANEFDDVPQLEDLADFLILSHKKLKPLGSTFISVSPTISPGTDSTTRKHSVASVDSVKDLGMDFIRMIMDPHIPISELKQLLAMQFTIYYTNPRPVPKSLKQIKCCMKRDRKGFMKRLYPKYSLYLLDPREYFLLAAQKMQILRSDYYLITLDKEKIDRYSEKYMGKVRSNFFGSKFSLYGEGDNPSNGGPPDKIREQHAGIIYVFFLMKLYTKNNNRVRE
eukprot:TRINITY_DN71667_c0_g1_i1.p1 TRINITY_DN71667_c0_g1~~TRINITY_DN71667_c0_g1_i1.p1  ORF type:complete len:286 (+),score=6.30 TRINITY_DN71667_c0_g1_i1:84-860(+)